MILQIFDIFDSATGSYARPFFMVSKGEATRAFVDIINDKQSAIHKHPEDFTLFHLGSFNQETASFDPLPTPSSMGKAIQYVLDGHAHDHQTDTDNVGPLDHVQDEVQLPLSNGE